RAKCDASFETSPAIRISSSMRNSYQISVSREQRWNKGFQRFGRWVHALQVIRRQAADHSSVNDWQTGQKMDGANCRENCFGRLLGRLDPESGGSRAIVSARPRARAFVVPGGVPGDLPLGIGRIIRVLPDRQ